MHQIQPRSASTRLCDRLVPGCSTPTEIQFRDAGCHINTSRSRQILNVPSAAMKCRDQPNVQPNNLIGWKAREYCKAVAGAERNMTMLTM